MSLNYPTLDDSTLISLISGSDENALGELYDRYAKLVFSLALNSTSDPKIAEEITQDVFFRIWQKAATYRAERAKVTTWLVTMARNRTIDALRRRAVRPEQHSVPWVDVPSTNTTSANDPEYLASLSLLQDSVRAAVAQLPPKQQEALSMAFFQGLSHQEIADSLGEPLGTIKTRIRLAMQKLRTILGD